MKGDFSRSSFDPRKHYRSVRMQQGRVQLDADWNEQQDILLHLITTQLDDLLDPGGTTAVEAGFAITLVEQTGEPADENEEGLPDEHTRPGKRLPDFQIGAGRYYVDGVVCENEAPVLFSRQPDFPGAASLPGPVDDDHFIVYLDVWQRHLTAAEDPAIREIALGGPDTTTRTQTVWQAKLLPLPRYPDDDHDWHDDGGLRSLADWQAFVARAAGRGRLRAQWQDRGTVLENHLYRVEIHGVDDDGVTFKWSRENGTVVFPITDIRPSPAQQDDHGTLIMTVEGLERDPLQLQEGDWVELVDDVTVLDSRPLPLCRVTELDRPSGQVTLQAKKENIDRVVAETSQRELEHPLLRRWEDNANPIAPQAGTTATQGETWLDLERGIQLAFSERGTYQVGDYWLIPARTRLDGGIEWPKEEGRPLAQAPHGIAHHYAPLALLQFQEGEEGEEGGKGREGAWSIVPGAGTRFHSLPQMTAQLSTTDEQLQSMASHLKKIQETLDTLVEQSSRIHSHIFQDFSSLDALEVGHAVAFDPSREDHVTLASKENERLVVGVVTEPIDKDNQRCRVVLYGRVRCKVVGRVEPGDLLVVASDVRGYAEKGGWYLRPGTILGKALSDKDEETGTVDMLVTLG